MALLLKVAIYYVFPPPTIHKTQEFEMSGKKPQL